LEGEPCVAEYETRLVAASGQEMKEAFVSGELLDRRIDLVKHPTCPG